MSYKKKLELLKENLLQNPDIVVEQFYLGDGLSKKKLETLFNPLWDSKLKKFYLECNGALIVWRHKNSLSQVEILKNNPTTSNNYNPWEQGSHQPNGLINILPLEEVQNGLYWNGWLSKLKDSNNTININLNNKKFSLNDAFRSIRPFDLTEPSNHTFINEEGLLFYVSNYNTNLEDSAFKSFDEYFYFLINSLGLRSLRSAFFRSQKPYLFSPINSLNIAPYLDDIKSNSELDDYANVNSIIGIESQIEWDTLFRYALGTDKQHITSASYKIRNFVDSHFKKIPFERPERIFKLEPYVRSKILKAFTKQKLKEVFVNRLVEFMPTTGNEIAEFDDGLSPLVELFRLYPKGMDFLLKHLPIAEKSLKPHQRNAQKIISNFLATHLKLASSISLSDINEQHELFKYLNSFKNTNYLSQSISDNLIFILNKQPELFEELDFILLKKNYPERDLINVYRNINGQVLHDNVKLKTCMKFLAAKKFKFAFKALPNLWISSDTSVAQEALNLTANLKKQAKPLVNKLKNNLPQIKNDNLRSLAEIIISEIS